MAIDQTNIALDLASELVQLDTQLVELINEINAKVTHFTQSGINFTNFETNFATSGELMHVDGATLNRLTNTIMPALNTWLTTTLVGGKSYWKVLHEISR